MRVGGPSTGGHPSAKKWGVRTQGSPQDRRQQAFPVGPVRARPQNAFLVHFELKSKNLVIINYKFGHYDQHANFIFRLSGLKGRGHDPRGGATVLKVGGDILRAKRAKKIF